VVTGLHSTTGDRPARRQSQVMLGLRQWQAGRGRRGGRSDPTAA